MALKVFNNRKRKNGFLQIIPARPFRDDQIVVGRHTTTMLFLSTFWNPYFTYEAITKPLPNGTYKIQVVAEDDLENRSNDIEGNAVIDFYPLPPVNLQVSLSGSNVTLTWEHSSAGAPDNYKIYGNGGSGNIIDRGTVIANLVGTTLTHTFSVANGNWLFVVESVDNSKESLTQKPVFITVPVGSTLPPSPGIPSGNVIEEGVVGLSLSRVSVGKVNIKFLWLYGALATHFRVYHNDGLGGAIDYNTHQYEFARVNGLFQEFTTNQLFAVEENRTYAFSIRAKNSYGNVDLNEQVYYIDVDGEAPDDPDTLTLDTVF